MEVRTVLLSTSHFRQRLPIIRYSSSPFLQPQVLFTTNEPQSYVFGGRNHPLHSNSQKKYLEDYARRNCFENIRHFTDDGFSGVNFNRPGFQALIKEIEAGNVGTLIVKDMSRLGRNYLQVGFYTEILFPQKDVRFLAISNSIDSNNASDNDFAPFLNLVQIKKIQAKNAEIKLFNAKEKTDLQ